MNNSSGKECEPVIVFESPDQIGWMPRLCECHFVGFVTRHSYVVDSHMHHFSEMVLLSTNRKYSKQNKSQYDS